MKRRVFSLGWVLAGGSLFFAACRESGPAGAPATEPAAPPMKGETAPADGDFVGLDEVKGAELAASRGLKHRILSVDGKPRPATKDYRPDRINFELVEGKITAVSRG
jgi:hypothetical protein